MAMPPQSGPMPPPQPYPGMYYAPMGLENFLSRRRNLFFLNAGSLFFMWIGFLISLATIDPGFHSLARLLIVTFGLFAAASSVAGALGSKKTTDSQNLGLFVWAGIVLVAAILLSSLAIL